MWKPASPEMCRNELRVILGEYYGELWILCTAEKFNSVEYFPYHIITKFGHPGLTCSLALVKYDTYESSCMLYSSQF